MTDHKMNNSLPFLFPAALPAAKVKGKKKKKIMKQAMAKAFVIFFFFFLSSLAIAESKHSHWDKLKLRQKINRGRTHTVRNGKGQLIRQFLSEHNTIRTAFGEPSLTWNRTLAKYARRWADTRISTCQLEHSADGHPPYGENIYCGQDYDRHPISLAVQSWASEAQYYDPDTNTCETSHVCGHYTQIVWRTTTQVGCARVKCDNGGVFMICSYNPPGNYHGIHPFSFESPFEQHFKGEDPPSASSDQTPSSPGISISVSIPEAKIEINA